MSGRSLLLKSWASRDSNCYFGGRTFSSEERSRPSVSKNFCNYQINTSILVVWELVEGLSQCEGGSQLWSLHPKSELVSVVKDFLRSFT